MEDRYLGDGVYASFDGENVILYLRDQDDTRIALGPGEFSALERFVNESYESIS